MDGNTLSDFGAEYFETMLDHGGFPICESTAPSGRYPKQWHLPSWRRVLQRPDVDYIDVDMCAFGLGPPNAPGEFYRHATRIVFPRHEPLRQALLRVCPGVGPGHQHVPLKGNRPGVPVSRCTEAGVYAQDFVSTVVRVLRQSLQVGRGGPGFAPRAGRAGGRGDDEARENIESEAEEGGAVEEEEGGGAEGAESEESRSERGERDRSRSGSRVASSTFYSMNTEELESHARFTEEVNAQWTERTERERREKRAEDRGECEEEEERRTEDEIEEDRSAVRVGRTKGPMKGEEQESESVSNFGRDPNRERKRRICREGPDGGRCGFCSRCNPTHGYLDWGQEVPVWREPEPIEEQGVGAGSSTDRQVDGGDRQVAGGGDNEEPRPGPVYGHFDDAWELGPGYVMVRHYRPRRTLFVPPAHGEATLGPDRFRNERQTHIEYERVDGSTGRVKVTDNS